MISYARIKLIGTFLKIVRKMHGVILFLFLSVSYATCGYASSVSVKYAEFSSEMQNFEIANKAIINPDLFNSIKRTFGYTQNKAVANVKIEDTVSLKRVIVIDSAFLDDLEVWSLNSNVKPELIGYRRLWDREVSFGRQPFFELPEATSLNLLVIAKSGNPISLPIKVLDKVDYQRYVQLDLIVISIYYGLMLCLVLYNLVIFSTSGVLNYLYYSLFIFSFAAMQSSLDGMLKLVSGSAFEDKIYHVLFASFPLFVAVFGSIFCNHFFLSNKKLNKIYAIFTYIAGITIVMLLIFKPEARYVSTISIVFMIAMVIGAFSLLPFVFKKQKVEAIIFMVAWGCEGLGVVSYVIMVVGVINNSWFSNYAMHLGSSMEGLLLLMAVGYSIRRLQEERSTAEKNAIEMQLSQTGFLAVRLADRLNSPLNTLLLSKEELEFSLSESDAGEIKKSVVFHCGVVDNCYKKMLANLSQLYEFKKFAPENSLSIEIKEEVEKLLDSLHHNEKPLPTPDIDGPQLK